MKIQKSIIKTNAELFDWLYPRKTILSVDCETTSLDYFEMKLVGVSFCDGENACYVDLWENPKYSVMLKTLKVFFHEYGGTLIMHNSIFDLKVLYKFGILR